MQPAKDKKTVSVLGTGGTIASYVDYRTGRFTRHCRRLGGGGAGDRGDMQHPLRSDLLHFQRDVTVDHWQTLAAAVADRLNGGVDGCIIRTARTRSGYTSAAIWFVLEGLTRTMRPRRGPAFFRQLLPPTPVEPGVIGQFHCGRRCCRCLRSDARVIIGRRRGGRPSIRCARCTPAAVTPFTA